MDTSKPKIFIASSGRAILLAEALANYLSDIAEVQRWYRSFPPGFGTLDSLLTEAGDCDFAAVLLTEDDVLHKGNLEVLAPRDNCVFELGLFIGALNLEPRRCFMLTSTSRDALPSDLKGRTYIPIKKLASDEFDNEAKCREAIENPIGRLSLSPGMQIRESIKSFKKLNRKDLPLISKDELMLIERPTPDGLLVERADVVVKSAQPVERDYEFATLVQTNMKSDANVMYKYFFYILPDEGSIRSISFLIQTLAVAGIEELKSFSRRKQGMAQYKERVANNLNTMKKNLSIYFLKEHEPVDFFVYNTGTLDTKSFLRFYGDTTTGFIEWYKGAQANLLATQLTKLCVPLKDHKNPHVFRSTTHFDLYSSENVALKNRLEYEICVLIHEDEVLQQKLKEMCFES